MVMRNEIENNCIFPDIYTSKLSSIIVFFLFLQVIGLQFYQVIGMYACFEIFS